MSSDLPGGHPGHLPIRALRMSQSSTMAVDDGQKGDPLPYAEHKGTGDRPAASYSPPDGYQQHQAYITPRHPPHRLRSVVTGSFSGSSFEEEREDISGRARAPSQYTTNPSGNLGMYHPQQASRESRYPEDAHMREGAEQRDDEHTFRAPQPAPEYNPAMVPASPSSKRSMEEMLQDTRDGSTFKPTDNLRRSFWHHSQPEDRKFDSLPPEFAPPKKAKIGKGPRMSEKVMAPSGSQQWYQRTQSWGMNDGQSYSPNHQPVQKSFSFPSQASWNGNTQEVPLQYRPSSREQPTEAGYPPQWSPHGPRSAQSAFRGVQSRRSPQGQRASYEPIPVTRADSFTPSEGGMQWRGSFGGDWSLPPPPSPNSQVGLSRSWSGPMGSFPPEQSAFRETSRSDSDAQRQVSFESGGDGDPHHRFSRDQKSPPIEPAKVSLPNSKQGSSPPRSPPAEVSRRALSPVLEVAESGIEGKPILLCQPEDRISLSETLCLIRENVEVFTATTTHVEAPAPGRKHPIVVGQVGLRCIHCKHATRSSDKVKRAVCYPSSIKRIYRTVIDMKLDHFNQCAFVPSELKERLEQLKTTNTRSTGTTMQYFIRSAKKMGMVDATPGVRLVLKEDAPVESPPPEVRNDVSSEKSAACSPPNAAEERDPPASGSVGGLSGSHSVDSRDQSTSTEESLLIQAVASIASDEDIPGFNGIVGLALPEDKKALSPLRCFLRQNVCAFTATEEDIAVRTPNTFSVVLGQVGIGCIHCQKLPAKERSNRAVCFPFSINRIYQSVADIQRFHLGECKMVPPQVRERFLHLQSASSKGSKGLATRQYWVSSAKKIGLVDTSRGIRFGRDPNVPNAPAVSLDILAQVASNVTTVNRPLVVPEDKECIAEFLYVVMEQLQPCRFTEADRNKRRLKDVGCIGVECKHCAGQVESRKFFWSSVNAVESNFVSVHTHMMECRMVPKPLKKRLAELKALRKEQTARLKIGSQKAFFARVWERLHAEDVPEAEIKGEDKAKSPPATAAVDRVSEKMAIVSV